MYHTTQTQNLKSTFWPCVLDLIQGYKSHKRVLRSISDTIHAVPSALFPLFQCDTAALPGEAGNDRLSKIWHLTRPVTSSVTFRYNLATYSESSNPELSNLVLGSRIRPALWQIAGGGETTPTPSACRVREYPCIGARVNPRRPGGSDSIPPPHDFSWITSLALQVSTRNLACLFVYRFYALTQNVGRFSRHCFELYRFKWPNVVPFLVENR